MEGTVKLERLDSEFSQPKNKNRNSADKGNQGSLQIDGRPPQAKQPQIAPKAVVLVSTVILYYFLSYFQILSQANRKQERRYEKYENSEWLFNQTDLQRYMGDCDLFL